MFKRFQRFRNDAGISEHGFACDRDGLTIRGTEYRPARERLPAAMDFQKAMTQSRWRE